MGNYNNRDGLMQVNGSHGAMANYEPNSHAENPVENKAYALKQFAMVGKAGRYAHDHPNDNYEQPRMLFRKVFDDAMRQKVMDNISGGLGKCRRDIQERVIKHFYKIDHEYGSGIAKRIGLPVEAPRL